MRRVRVVTAVAGTVLFAGFGTASAQPQATSIWVAPGSEGRQDGSRAHPHPTLHRAQREVRRVLAQRPAKKISVILKGGTHRLAKPLRLGPKDSGRGGRVVSYQAAPGQRPVISGARRVRGWERWDSERNVWRARVPKGSQSRELYVDGRRAQRARTSDYPAGFLPSWNGGGPDSGIEYLPTIEPDGLNPAAWGDPTEWRHPKDIEAVILTQWKQMSVPLQRVRAASGGQPGLLEMREPGWFNANVFRDAKTGQPGLWSFWQVSWFENALAFLDEPGEWYLDRHRGWLYYMPRPWEKPRQADFELPVLESLIEGSGSPASPIHDLSFRGLQFSHATWLGPSSDNGYVSDQAGFHLVGAGHDPNTIGHDPDLTATPGNVSFRYGRDLLFSGNRFTRLGGVGLSLGTGSKRTTVRSNTFTDVGSSAIQLGGIAAADHHPPTPAQLAKDNRIVHNLVSGVARSYRDAPGIFAGFGARTRIAHNTIEDVPWTGIALGWGWGLFDPPGFPGLPGATRYEWGRYETPTPNRNSVVAHNTISDFLNTLWDGGAIYTTGFQGTSAANGLQIHSNTAYGKRPTGGGNTFYTDGGSRWITVRDNTSYSNPIGEMDFGPPPRAGDPLPYPKEPSKGNGLPYGSEIGGCVTYGDINYRRNSWFEAPMWEQIPLYNDLYDVISGGKLKPYSPEGFFNVCPFKQDGISYPTNLTFKDNAIYPQAP